MKAWLAQQKKLLPKAIDIVANYASKRCGPEK
jgi:hypothetical protein